MNSTNTPSFDSRSTSHWLFCAAFALAMASMAGTTTTAHAAPDREAKNSIFLEFGGPGGLYSINYERLIFAGLGVRVGFSYLQLKLSDEVASADVDGKATFWSIPVVLDYIGISTGKHSLELGLGASIIKLTGDVDVENVDILNVVGRTTFGTFVAGYRIQRPDGGFQFRIGYSPLFGHGIYQHWAYLSLGGSF